MQPPLLHIANTPLRAPSFAPLRALTLWALLCMMAVAVCGCDPRTDDADPSATEEPQTEPESNADEDAVDAAPPGPHDELLAGLNQSVEDGGTTLARVGHHELDGRTLHHFQLSNGLNVILLKEDFAPVISYQTWLRAGSRHEPTGKEGVAHLLEHLMFRRTKNLAEGEYDREMERYGIDPSATTWLDYTYYYQKIPKERLAHVMALEAERLANLKVVDEVFQAERDVVLRERQYRIDNNPQGAMLEQLYHAAFPSHPYRHPTLGYPESLKAITAEDCQTFYDEYYAPNNAALVLVGDLELEPTLRLVLEHYGPLQPADTPADDAREDPLPKERDSALFEMPVDAEMMVFGFPSPPLDHPDNEPYDVLNEAMFASPHGKLYRELKLDKEWVTAVNGWVPWFQDRALYEVFVTLKPGVQHEETRKRILHALASVRAEPPTDTELQRAINRVELDFLETAQDVSALAEGLGHYWVVTGEPQRFLTRIDRVKAVTIDDLQRISGTYFRPPLLSEVLVLPTRGDE